MKKILLFFLIVSLSLIAYPRNIKCYLFELEGDKLVLKKVSDRPLIAEKENQAVIILDEDKTPTKEHLLNLRKSIITKLYRNSSKETGELRKYISQEREIELLRWAVKSLVEGKPLPKAVLNYFKKIEDITKTETTQ